MDGNATSVKNRFVATVRGNVAKRGAKRTGVIFTWRVLLIDVLQSPILVNTNQTYATLYCVRFTLQYAVLVTLFIAILMLQTTGMNVYNVIKLVVQHVKTYVRITNVSRERVQNVSDERVVMTVLGSVTSVILQRVNKISI